MEKRKVYKLDLDQVKKLKNKKRREAKHHTEPAKGFKGFQYSLNQREFIQEKMYELETHEFMVVYLKFWKDFTDDEISKLLSIDESTMMNILESSLAKLRTIYENEFSNWEKNLKIRMRQIDQDNLPADNGDLVS